jgi:RimJ/RimL family protein N-acetyltransferase
VSGLAEVLRGRLVLLEPFEPRHEDALWEAATEDRSIWRWMKADYSGSRERFHAYLQHAAPGDVTFATLDAASGIALGSSRFLAVREEDRVVEIGSTWLRRSAWGTGANVEAKLLMLRHAFEGWRAQRVELKTDARNERSRGAMEAFGARFEGIARKHMVCEYGVRDSAWYAVTDDEWPDVRRTLEQRLRSAAPASA